MIECSFVMFLLKLEAPSTDVDLCRDGGSCGLNAECHVENGREQCKCRPGTAGNPYLR